MADDCLGRNEETLIMLDLAISTDTDRNGIAVIETNRGERLKAPRWPQDCDFQLVAFNPAAKSCDVVWTEALANDIGKALKALAHAGVLKGRKPDWYHRLMRCANGAV
ncbi:MAG: hypothetical protein WA117_17880 [Verrucomicrobiia bacterium]